MQVLIDDYHRKRDSAVRVASSSTTSTSAQPGLVRTDRPVYFISRVLKSYEVNYTILELEMAIIVCAILKFQRYLDGSVFTIFTDH